MKTLEIRVNSAGNDQEVIFWNLSPAEFTARFFPACRLEPVDRPIRSLEPAAVYCPRFRIMQGKAGTPQQKMVWIVGVPLP